MEDSQAEGRIRQLQEGIEDRVSQAEGRIRQLQEGMEDRVSSNGQHYSLKQRMNGFSFLFLCYVCVYTNVYHSTGEAQLVLGTSHIIHAPRCGMHADWQCRVS